MKYCPKVMVNLEAVEAAEEYDAFEDAVSSFNSVCGIGRDEDDAF